MHSLQIKPLVPWLWLANHQCIQSLWKSQENQLGKHQWLLLSQMLNLLNRNLLHFIFFCFAKQVTMSISTWCYLVMSWEEVIHGTGHLQVFTVNMKTCFSSPRETCGSCWTNSYHWEDKPCHKIHRKKAILHYLEGYRPFRKSSETPLHCTHLIKPLPPANIWPHAGRGTTVVLHILSPPTHRMGSSSVSGPCCDCTYILLMTRDVY